MSYMSGQSIRCAPCASFGYLAIFRLLSFCIDAPCAASTRPAHFRSKHKTCPLSQVAHAWLRYKSLAVLQFDSINQKRACLLARASVKGHKLPGEKSACTSGNCLTVHHLKREGIQDQEINGIAGVLDGNQRESVLAWPSLARPSLTFASSLEDMLGSSATLLGAQVGPFTQSRLLPAAFCPPQQLRTQCTAGAGFDSKNLCNLCFRLFVIPMLTVDTC